MQSRSSDLDQEACVQSCTILRLQLPADPWSTSHFDTELDQAVRDRAALFTFSLHVSDNQAPLFQKSDGPVEPHPAL